ncbi:MAG TPA: SDR family NAD(P)-dependent oxidoreductase [Solirubrobacterales bacterium]|nr:SDR family NAD(P)-dependent oxidoreductase [Solirubrobacterales bacterium]
MPTSITAITGGSGGIGLATARRLLESSPDDGVALVDLHLGEAESLVHEHPDRARFVACNVTDPDAVARAFREIDQAGEITGLVNGAGTVDNSASVELSFEKWRALLAVHLDGALLCSQEAGRRMLERERGAIVNVGSVAGLFGHPRRLPYSVAKAGLQQMTRTLAVEWAERGVRVNAVAPGFVATPMVEEVVKIGLINAEDASSLHAMKRLGKPSEIAAAIAFLLSEDASFITGETLRVDGGYSVLKAS